MKAFLRKIATVLLPEKWRARLRPRFAWRWFRGSYASWAEARAASEGYDDSTVLARVVAATRKVRAGLASWERDGWAFDVLEVSHPLLSALKIVANENGGILDVVDFGGSLGSTWWQHRSALRGMGAVHWRVVEQEHFVEAGHEFACEELSFHGRLDEALQGRACSAILLSSVLPYLEKPHDLLKEMSHRGFSHVILDRTPFVTSRSERLVVQHTPPELGGGSYPCWLFDRSQIIASVGPDFRLVSEWPGSDVIDQQVEYKGMHFQKISSKGSL